MGVIKFLEHEYGKSRTSPHLKDTDDIYFEDIVELLIDSVV
jgi:hypothetical protein